MNLYIGIWEEDDLFVLSRYADCKMSALNQMKDEVDTYPCRLLTVVSDDDGCPYVQDDYNVDEDGGLS